MQKLLRDYVRNYQFKYANTEIFLNLINTSLLTEVLILLNVKQLF